MIEFTGQEGVTWRVDADFLSSNWRCIWGEGCLGIGDEPDRTHHLGCCSVGAQMADEHEAMEIAALAAMVPDELFQHRAHAVFRDEGSTATAIVDGACVFLNRPGFEGGAGCALHLAAVAAGERPIDWKPSVCWQVPLKVETANEGGREIVTIRRRSRPDWGEGGESMAWICCDADEAPEAFVGDRPVVESLAGELDHLMGPADYETLVREVRRVAP